MSAFEGPSAEVNFTVCADYPQALPEAGFFPTHFDVHPYYFELRPGDAISFKLLQPIEPGETILGYGDVFAPGLGADVRQLLSGSTSACGPELVDVVTFDPTKTCSPVNDSGKVLTHLIYRLEGQGDVPWPLPTENRARLLTYSLQRCQVP